MQVHQSKTKFEQAAEHLEAAKNELNRPAEDVVPFMVCRSARLAISDYLQGYLMHHGIAFDATDTEATLLEKCREVDSKFNDFDLSAITFSKDDEYSAEFDEMESTIDLAEHAKQLVGQ